MRGLDFFTRREEALLTDTCQVYRNITTIDNGVPVKAPGTPTTYNCMVCAITEQLQDERGIFAPFTSYQVKLPKAAEINETDTVAWAGKTLVCLETNRKNTLRVLTVARCRVQA